jgi:peptidoglycan hydrolase-like protein with peptidoglycan-binding domain
MPDWGNDPSAFGWSAPPPLLIPFIYGGHVFPQGVDARVSMLFHRALDILCKQPGFRLHSGAGLDDGDWGYEQRQVTGGGALSFHAYGTALDINAPWNPYGVALPDPTPYRLPPNTGELLRPLGILWGGGPEWGRRRDWMHIENHNSPAELAGAGPPPRPAPTFPLARGRSFGQTADAWTVNGYPPVLPGQTASIERIQGAVGAAQDGLYGPRTFAAVVAFQRRHALQVDGRTGPKTWAVLLSA